MTFRELKIGDTFDFIKEGSIYNSFFLRCTKTSERMYTWNDKHGKPIPYRIGSINAEVYHVEPN